MNGHLPITRITVQCDACGFGDRCAPPLTMPAGWDCNILNELLCPRCVERAAKAAGNVQALGDPCDFCGGMGGSCAECRNVAW